MVIGVKIRRKSVSRWLQYLYFLRFPILGWLILPLLCYLDAFTGVNAITRGIMTLSRMWQAFYVAFFAPGLGMTVYICAKNLVRNSESRFSTATPAVLRLFLRGPNTRATWYALVFAHIPTLVTLAYVAYITIIEKEATFFGVGYWRLWVGYLLGILLSAVFWYLVSFFYIWIHPAAGPDSVTIPLLPTPHAMVLWAQITKQPNYAKWIENITGKFLKLSCEGYSASQNAPIWPLHLLSIVALSAFLMLYFFLYPLTAPVYFSSGILEGGIAILVYAICVYGARTATGMDSIGRMFTAVKTLFLVLLLWFLVWDFFTKKVHLETAFPVLASLLVIFIFSQWLFSGASFFLDRYRIPVLTSVLALIFLPKLLPIDQDHYFEVSKIRKVTTIDTPSLAIEDRVPNFDEPYIIVTASGGGIRAAEWTAQVMSQLEKRFREDPSLQMNHYQFHDHLLLASGVSGGSVGLLPYLLEYTADQPFAEEEERDLESRLTQASVCSSLEAVAWGLEYYDLQRLLFTFRPVWLQSGEAPDRTWALTEALNRNLRDEDLGCPTSQLNRPKGVQDGKSVKLDDAAVLLHASRMPAFSFNTTVAETGGRFLLSNYFVPPMPPVVIGKTDFLPAESFLQAYAQESKCDAAQVENDCYLDISLATAARLSATFPIVSSATRIPKEFARTASHFLDGGYFDNDGTATVTEFLYSALEERERNIYLNRHRTRRPGGGAPPEPANTGPPVRPLKRLRILLVEIRDGDDMNPTKNIDDWNHQVGSDLETGADQPMPWKIFNEIVSPLEGLWNAGHVSTTRRNRRELCLLERTYYRRHQDNLEIHHIVLGIPSEPEPNKPNQFRTPPLSWKLTASQGTYIHDWAVAPDKPTQTMIADAIEWVRMRLPIQLEGNKAVKEGADYPQCEIDDQTYMRR